MKIKSTKNKAIWLFFNIALLIIFFALSVWYAYKTSISILNLIHNQDFMQNHESIKGLFSSVLQIEENNLILLVVCFILSQFFWWVSILKVSVLLGETRMISQTYLNTKKIKWLTKLNRVFLFLIITWPISLILDLCAIIYLHKLNKQLIANKNYDNRLIKDTNMR